MSFVTYYLTRPAIYTYNKRIPEFGSSFLKCGSSKGALWSYGPISNSSIIAKFSSLLFRSSLAVSSTGFAGGRSSKPDERAMIFVETSAVEVDAKVASLDSTLDVAGLEVDPVCILSRFAEGFCSNEG